MKVSKNHFQSTAKKLGIQDPIGSMTPENILEVARHLKAIASDDFELPKLKLKTKDISKIGLIDVDGKMMTIEELQNLKEVKGSLTLSRMGLTELPDLSHLRVGGHFNCSNNDLTSLQGAPQKVGGSFYCFDNKLTTLQGGPNEVGLDYDCSGNKLMNLGGAPRELSGSFDCVYNRITSLEGAPRKVGGQFKCYGNYLSTLEGAPDEVGRDFNCHYNKLTSLEGAPREVGRNFDCSNNEREFSEEDVRGVSNVKGEIILW